MRQSIRRCLGEKNNEIAKLKTQIDSLQSAKDADLQQIQELIEANARLEFEKRHTYVISRLQRTSNEDLGSYREDDLASLRKEMEDLKAKLVSGKRIDFIYHKGFEAMIRSRVGGDGQPSVGAELTEEEM